MSCYGFSAAPRSMITPARLTTYRRRHMDLGLKNRLALVSGSTAGIGYAIAAALSREGARAIVNGRTQDAVEKAVASIAASTGNTPFGFAGNLSMAAEADRLA